MSCNPTKIVTNKEDFISKKPYIDKYAEPMESPTDSASHPVSIPTIEQVEVKGPLKEIIEDEIQVEENSTNEEEEIKRLLKEKFDIWYNTNRDTIKYQLSLFIFSLFGFILLLYWLVRLINKISPNKLGFSIIVVLIMSLLLLGIVVYL